MKVKSKKRAGCSGNHGLGGRLPLFFFPVPCGAMTVIGVSALPHKGGECLLGSK